MGKVLVTGSSGFIGTQIVRRLPESQVVTDSNNGRTDLRSREQVMGLEPADIVIHLGGKTPQDNLGWSEYFENNTTGTLNILEYCMQNKAKSLIYVSSYVYGSPKYCPVDEGHPVNPHNAYTESKYLGERLCKFYSDRSDLSVTVLRPFNIFGRSMREGYLISNLVNAARTGSEVTITNKDSRRDFLYVDDFVDLVIKVMDHGSKFDIFNVGSGVSYSFDEIVEKIQKMASKKLNIKYDDDPASFIGEITADISKVKNKTGWQPKTRFDDGLAQVFGSVP